jgi:endonuclease/exonuclease/phosphatase family metal-dependent hydrolase
MAKTRDSNTAGAGPVDRDALAVSFNAANKKANAKSAQSFREKLFPAGKKPELIIASVQEAGRDQNGKNIAELALEETGDYDLVHVNGMDVHTKLDQQASRLGIGMAAQTALVIAVKKGSDLKVAVEASGIERDPKNDNKGGAWAILNINGKRIGVVSAHLDSKDPKLREYETEKLLAHFKGLNPPIDSIVFLGDLNERLDLGNELVNQEPTTREGVEGGPPNANDLEVEPRVPLKEDPSYGEGRLANITPDNRAKLLQQHGQVQNRHLADFSKSTTGEFTYAKKQKLQLKFKPKKLVSFKFWTQVWERMNNPEGFLGKLRKRGKNNIDAGELDRVCTKNTGDAAVVQLGESRTIEPKEDGEAFSDHLGVVTKLTITCGPAPILHPDNEAALQQLKGIIKATTDFKPKKPNQHNITIDGVQYQLPRKVKNAYEILNNPTHNWKVKKANIQAMQKELKDQETHPSLRGMVAPTGGSSEDRVIHALNLEPPAQQAQEHLSIDSDFGAHSARGSVISNRSSETSKASTQNRWNITGEERDSEAATVAADHSRRSGLGG